MKQALLDGRPLAGLTGLRGVGRYVRFLAEGIASVARDFELSLLIDPRRSIPTRPAVPLTEFSASSPPGPQLLWGQLLGPRWLGAAKADLFHATFLAPPRVPAGCPWVSTIHDLIPLEYPQHFGWKRRQVFSFSLRRNATADRVVCVSRATADRVALRFGVPAARIEVIEPPVDVARFAHSTRGGMKGLEHPYLLHLGGFDPLKGVEDLLLPAFARLAAEVPELRLVLTGPIGAGQQAAARRGFELGIKDRLLFPGTLDDAAHVEAVVGARAVVISSREEGFGIPAVEALAAGVPLAIGPAEAPREAAHGFACLSQGEGVDGLAEAMHAAWNAAGPNSSVGEARRLHAARFSPRAIGARMATLYRGLMR